MPDTIRLIDVGARGGIHERWRPFYGLPEVRAFEADPQECTALNSRGYPCSHHQGWVYEQRRRATLSHFHEWKQKVRP